MLNNTILFFVTIFSFQIFANPVPQNFDEVNQSFQQAYDIGVDHIADRAFKGVCYLSTSKIIGAEGYVGGIILGTAPGVYEKRIGTVYRLSGNEPYTKGSIFSTLFLWWSKLSPINPGNPLTVENTNSPDIDIIKQSGQEFISQSRLKADFDCNYTQPDLQPLCVNGFIPKGTHYKSCFYFEELK